MREALDQWNFVVAAYAIGLLAMGAILLWSWLDMRRAERRRDEARGR